MEELIEKERKETGINIDLEKKSSEKLVWKPQRMH